MPQAFPFAGQRIRQAVLILIVALAYVAAGKGGLELATVNPSATAVWAPTGIAVAAFLLIGPASALGVFAGAFVVNATTSGTVLTALLISIGNTLEGYVIAELMKRFALWPETFRHVRAVFMFTIVTLIGVSVSSTVGVASLILTGFAQSADFGRIWFTWMVGDAVGALVVAPLLLLWCAEPTRLLPHKSKRSEAIVLVVFALVSAYVVFGEPFWPEPQRLPIVYLCFPATIWAALRFGSRAVATLTMTTIILSLVTTVNGYGPFAGPDPLESLLLMQLFMGILSITGLLLAALMSEREALEKANVGRERLFRSLIEHSFEAITLVKENGIISYASPSVYRMLGYRIEHLVGTQAFEYVHPDDENRAKEDVAEILRKPGSSMVSELRFRHRNGSWIWLEVVGTNLTQLPEVKAIVCNVRDISARKLEETAKSQFVSLASHQLRTPLTAIRWAINSLQMTAGSKLEKADREILSTAKDAASAMASSIETLLTLSQLEAGKIPLEHDDIRLSDLLRQVANKARPASVERQQSLAIDAPHHLTARSDRRYLSEILSILVDNAVKYSDRRDIVRIVASERPGAVVIEVQDRGIGIPVHEQSRVFSIFFRGENAVDRGTEGSGLGLHLAKAYARLLDAELSFISEEGRGSIFSLSFETA